MLLSILTLLTFFANSYGNLCTPEQGTYYVENLNQLSQLHNCSTINGNLRIIGEYNIDNLLHLSNLENINGHLMIVDSHALTSLAGLNNLKNIYGNDLHLNQYSVVIKNNNYINNTYKGLCFANSIDWNLITNNSILLQNNNNNCTPCDSQCDGCWNSGPNNCQNCLNFISGDFCVDNCGLLNNLSNTCLESNPGLVNISFTNLNESSLLLNWSKPIPENGYITGYKIFVNNELYYHDYLTLNNYLLTNSLTLNNLTAGENYNISIISHNSNFESELTNISIFFTGYNLDGQMTFENFNVSRNNLYLNWTINNIFGRDLYYSITLNNQSYNTTNTFINIDDLSYNYYYDLYLRACVDTDCSNYLYQNFTTDYRFTHNPNITNIFTNQTYAMIEWENLENAPVEYILLNGEILIENEIIYTNFIDFSNLIPNNNYLLRIKTINLENSNNYDTYDIITKNILVSTLSPTTSLHETTTITNTNTDTNSDTNSNIDLTTSSTTHQIINVNDIDGDDDDNIFNNAWIIFGIVCGAIIILGLIIYCIIRITNNRRLHERRITQINDYRNNYNNPIYSTQSVDSLDGSVDTSSIYNTTRPNMVPKNMVYT